MSSKELGEQRPTLDCKPEATSNIAPQSLGRPCEQSASYYFGVMLSSQYQSMDLQELKDHARNFFNEKVLPSLFERPVPEDKKLLSLGGDPYRFGQIGQAPMITPAVFRYPQFSGPRITNVGLTGSPGPLCLVSATGHVE